MQRPSPAIMVQLLLPCHPICHNGNSSLCEWRMPLRTGFHHSMHCAAPPPLPCPLPSTSVAFFIKLWFSDLVPYVVILKMFHVKKWSVIRRMHCVTDHWLRWQNCTNYTSVCFCTHLSLQIWPLVTFICLQITENCSLKRGLAQIRRWSPNKHLFWG